MMSSALGSENKARPRRDQFTGCLIGQCLGDALGFPMEGHSTEVCGVYASETLSDKSFSGPEKASSFGQYSDDSQLARELIQSFVSCKEFKPSDYALRIASIFKEGRIIGYGRSTQEAAFRLIEGVPWENAGTPAPAAGNGSAMRAAPIGLIFCDDMENMIQAAQDQGRITHQDKRCSAGAVCIAGAVSLVLRSHPIDRKAFLRTLAGWTGRIETSLSEGLEQLVDWVDLASEDVSNLLYEKGLAPDLKENGGLPPFVTGTVLWSIYSFLKSPRKYIKTISTAISVGGDVDTTAAMAGAISGAYLGIEAIPLHLSRSLNDRGTWTMEELVNLANECFELKVGGSKTG
ncbi:MAG: ADP-ribosylglycohydrolase family protein [Nitrososphaerales archaeon]